MAIIRIDYENNANEWWDALRERAAANDRSVPLCLPAALLDCTGQDVAVDDSDVAQLEKFFASLPGWSDGSDYARHPVVVVATPLAREWTPL